MLSANEARNLRQDNYSMEIEDKIKKASIDGYRSITITVGDWDRKDFQRIKPILEKSGYDVSQGGCAGWTSFYYTISW